MPTVYDFLNGWNVREPFQVYFDGKVYKKLSLYERIMYRADHSDEEHLLEKFVKTVDFTTNTIYCE